MTQIWAHRGASHDAPENTMAAFELAIEQGADGIELDVQLSADGHVVVCHDETLDRTSTGNGPLGALTLDELRRLSFDHGRGGQHPIPTLAEVLDRLADTDLALNIELKNTEVAYEGLEAAVEAAVATSRMAEVARERIVYSSFNHRSLEVLATSGTQVRLGALFVEPLVRSWEYVKTFGAAAIHPYWRSTDREEVMRCRAEGVLVHPWTIDDPDVMRRFAAAGVDAIITNVPALARATLG